MGVEQRAKGRLKLGHVLRTRFKENFHLQFQMWSRWAFVTRARRNNNNNNNSNRNSNSDNNNSNSNKGWPAAEVSVLVPILFTVNEARERGTDS